MNVLRMAVGLGWGIFGATVGPAQTPGAEDEAEVVGIEVARPAGGFLGVAVEGRAVVVRFYDEDKEPIDPDVPRGTVRWRKVGGGGQEFGPLNLDGEVLRSLPRLKPPYVFVAHINFLSDEGEVVESHHVDLKRLRESASEEAAAPASRY